MLLDCQRRLQEPAKVRMDLETRLVRQKALLPLPASLEAPDHGVNPDLVTLLPLLGNNRHRRCQIRHLHRRLFRASRPPLEVQRRFFPLAGHPVRRALSLTESYRSKLASRRSNLFLLEINPCLSTSSLPSHHLRYLDRTCRQRPR